MKFALGKLDQFGSGENTGTFWFGGGEDGSRQLGVRLDGLGRDDDAPALAGKPLRAAQSDSARGAGDECNFAHDVSLR